MAHPLVRLGFRWHCEISLNKRKSKDVKKLILPKHNNGDIVQRRYLMTWRVHLGVQCFLNGIEWTQDLSNHFLRHIASLTLFLHDESVSSRWTFNDQAKWCLMGKKNTERYNTYVWAKQSTCQYKRINRSQKNKWNTQVARIEPIRLTLDCRSIMLNLLKKLWHFQFSSCRLCWLLELFITLVRRTRLTLDWIIPSSVITSSSQARFYYICLK